MEMTQMESLWVLALASKFTTLSNFSNFIILFIILSTAWLVLALIHWAHPTGPAWGQVRVGRWNRFIPGPRGLPVLGSMGLMSGLSHHKLAEAANRFRAKRLMAFSLGGTRVIVTSNPEVAREILTSAHFADRPVRESAHSLLFNRAIGFAPYGSYWRTLRRIAAVHLFCSKQINASVPQRCEIAAQMASTISGFNGITFQARNIIRRASLNNMMSSVFGRKYGPGQGCNNGEMEELMWLVEEGYELLGMNNWSDHLPWLASLDLQKVRQRCSGLVPRVNRFVGRIIRQHREGKNQNHIQQQDFMDVLLSLQGSEKLGDGDIIAVLWEMIFRGTDTVAVLLEWIFARMVLHQDVQAKVHEELDRVVGRSQELVESDLRSLSYLSAVVKEVLRLHPPGPLLAWARLSTEDTLVDGHQVPAGTTAMVNMWAITRDPEVWDDPLVFRPERFMSDSKDNTLDMEFSVFGSDLRLAPFGSGRRVCPGKALGLTTVTYFAAHLLHDFEWAQGSHVDLDEELKLSCEMANPLTVNVTSRRG